LGRQHFRIASERAGCNNQHMDIEDYPLGEIVEKGTRIYDERLRQVLEPAHLGEYVVIDIETGEYEVDKDHMTALNRAIAKREGAPLYASRVGSRTIGRIAGVAA
jgi:hypothetical protein